MLDFVSAISLSTLLVQSVLDSDESVLSDTAGSLDLRAELHCFLLCTGFDSLEPILLNCDSNGLDPYFWSFYRRKCFGNGRKTVGIRKTKLKMAHE